jgi:hypothetical protein
MNAPLHAVADHAQARTPAARGLGAAPSFEERVDSPDGIAMPDLALANEAFDLEPHGDDAASFAREVSSPAAGLSVERLECLADQVCGFIEESRLAHGLQCEFSVEVPGMGALAGRLSITQGGADLALLPSRPALAAVLRSRLPVLQALVRRDSDGDVNLSIL